MAKEETISIDSFSEKDVNDLFNYICEHVILANPNDVKFDTLKFKDRRENMFKYKVTLEHLIKVIDKYDIDFKLSISYLSTEIEDRKDIQSKEVEDLSISLLNNDLDKIENPDLLHLKDRVEIVDTKSKIDSNSITDWDIT
jgi:hypothetical protein